MRGIDPNQLEFACRRLGDAVLDPAMWPQIMEDICKAAGALGAVLLQSDLRTSSDVPRTASINETIDRYFREGWHQRDPRARGVALLLQGRRVFADEDVITPEEMRRAPYYQELIYPSGLKWYAAVGFSAGSSSWALAIQRTAKEGPFEKHDKRLLAELSRSLTEVATLSTAVGQIALSSATNGLNRVRQPAVAIDRFGSVLDANAAAEALFDRHLRVTGRRLLVEDAEAKACLEKLIDRLRNTPDIGPLDCDPIVIRRNGRAPVVVRMLPVHGAARTPFLGARALLTLNPAEPRRGPEPALLCRAFGLTPAEARLATLIAEGLAPERAAEELGISTVTARNQLKAVFAKTDTHRQAELVAVLSRLGS